MITLLIIAIVAIAILTLLCLIGGILSEMMEAIFEGIFAGARAYANLFVKMRLWLKIVSAISIPVIPTGLTYLISWLITNDTSSAFTAAKVVLIIVGIIAGIIAAFCIFLGIAALIIWVGEKIKDAWDNFKEYLKSKRDLFFKKEHQ